MTPHTVFLVDDHPVLLHGLTAVIAMEPDFRIIGSTTNSMAAMKMIGNLKPDIVVLDINMPNLGGIALLRQMRNADLPVRAIFLTAIITPIQAFEAVENDIWGILLKHAKPHLVISCLRSVAAGRRWLAKEVSAQLAREQKPRSPHTKLTAREMEIAEYICLGLPNKAIAQQIGSSEGTVKVHIHNIFQKMGVTNRTSLAALFFSGGRSDLALGLPPSRDESLEDRCSSLSAAACSSMTDSRTCVVSQTLCLASGSDTRIARADTILQTMSAHPDVAAGRLPGRE